MNLLVVIAEMGTGGAETIVEDLALHRLSLGDAVTVASAGGFRADRLSAGGVATVHTPLAGRADLVRAVATIRGAVRRRDPRLVHVHNVKAAAVTRLATVGRRRPTLVTLHGVPDGAYASAARVLRRSADRLVAVSGDVAERVSAAGFPADRITVIDNAVQPPAALDRDESRSLLGIAPNQQVGVCVARLVDQKRHDLLVEAWSDLPDDAVLLVAGDGPNSSRLEAQIAARGLGERVRLLGARTDVDRLLSAADVFVLPSDWEGLPISVLEAMSVGVPVVASAVGELPAAVGGAAELVEPGSSSALAVGVLRMLSDAARRDAVRAAATRLVTERFGVERMRAEYDAEYARLLP